MKRYTIEQKFKSAAAFLVILILFPYIVSVFVNGVDPEETTNENFYIRVTASEEEEADGIAEVEWNEYLTGVLAKDVPADTETEALKAQAVLVRTQISRALQRSTQAEETENQKSDRTGNVSDVILEIDYLSQKEMQDQWPADEYKKRYEKYRNAIESTENEVLFYNDTYAWTPFHQNRSAYLRFPMIKYRKNVIIFWRQRQTEKKLRQDILLKILKF